MMFFDEMPEEFGELLQERRRIYRRVAMFQRYRVPEVLLTPLYQRIAELEAILQEQALMMTWAYQPVGEA